MTCPFVGFDLYFLMTNDVEHLFMCLLSFAYIWRNLYSKLVSVFGEWWRVVKNLVSNAGDASKSGLNPFLYFCLGNPWTEEPCRL